MTMKLATLFFSAAVAFGSFIGVAHAQPVNPQTGMAQVQLSPVNVQGSVAQFIRGPRGHVRALSLADGTIVRLGHGQGDALATRIAVGQMVRIQGFSRVNPAGARMIVRATISAPDGTVLAQPPARGQGGWRGGRGQARQGGHGRMGIRGNRQAIMAQLQPMNTSGTVQAAITGPQGHLRALTLANGTRVILPRPIAAQIEGRTISAGETVQIQGRGGVINPPQATPGMQPRGRMGLMAGGNVIVAHQITFANGATFTMPARPAQRGRFMVPAPVQQ